MKIVVKIETFCTQECALSTVIRFNLKKNYMLERELRENELFDKKSNPNNS